MKAGPTSTQAIPAPRATARLGRTRLLVVGCGDTGMHVLQRLAARHRVFALTSSPDRLPALRAAGAIPLVGNLDRPSDLRRLRGLARQVLMLAPPPGQGRHDTRSQHLAAVLRRPAAGTRTAGRRPIMGAPASWRAHQRSVIVAKRTHAGLAAGASAGPLCLVYASTTGVYGDARGALLDETRPVRPDSDRGLRRVAAETVWRRIGPARARQAEQGLAPWRTTILRIPGIYGQDRLPLDRLRRGLPRLLPADDVFTNHIEISDLAGAAIAALRRGRPQRIVHVCDGRQLKMGDYFDLVADATGLPRPPRLSADEVRQAVSPAMWSFMKESRRLDNTRLTKELAVRLRFPTVESALKQWFGDNAKAIQAIHGAAHLPNS